MKAYVSPEPSLRNTGVIFRFGRLVPLFSFVICGAFQLVILPRKISATTGPVRLSLRMPSRWNATPVALSAQGIWTHSLHSAACVLVSGASDAPKSTVRAEICAIPAPEPTAA